MLSFASNKLLYCIRHGSILGGNNNTDDPIYDVVKLQNKVIRIINDVPIRDLSTSRYSHWNISKFHDNVKLYTCPFLYDHLCNAKCSNFILPLLSEQYTYTTSNALHSRSSS